MASSVDNLAIVGASSSNSSTSASNSGDATAACNKKKEFSKSAYDLESWGDNSDEDGEVR